MKGGRNPKDILYPHLAVLTQSPVPGIPEIFSPWSWWDRNDRDLRLHVTMGDAIIWMQLRTRRGHPSEGDSVTCVNLRRAAVK